MLEGWSLKPMIYLAIFPVFLLTIYAWFDPNLRSVLGLAWDCGAVTTGPVTVPLVLSLGIGIANAAGKGGSSLSGFGVVTMASLFPILAVLILAIFVSFSITPDEIIAAAKTAGSVVVETAIDLGSNPVGRNSAGRSGNPTACSIPDVCPVCGP